jgi:hypothetical protein
MSPPIQHRHRRAFGLAEALMASTVLAIAVVGIALQLSAAHQQAGAVREHNLSVLLAKQLLEEIAAKPLCDKGATCHLGPESGETSRSQFDSADDYHKYTDDTQAIKDLTGAEIPFGGLTFRREVSVEYRTSPAGAPEQAGDFALVTVRVKAPGGYTAKISRLLTRQKVTF